MHIPFLCATRATRQLGPSAVGDLRQAASPGIALIDTRSTARAQIPCGELSQQSEVRVGTPFSGTMRGHGIRASLAQGRST